jgi:hypothetical protein
VFESMGIPPEFHHDGDLCWDGTGGAVDRIQQYLPFSMDRRIIKAVLIRPGVVSPPPPPPFLPQTRSALIIPSPLPPTPPPPPRTHLFAGLGVWGDRRV